MLRRALARGPSAAALAPARRRPPTLVPARTRFSIDIDERTPAEFAMARRRRGTGRHDAWTRFQRSLSPRSTSSGVGDVRLRRG